MHWQSKWVWVESVRGARRSSNLFWAFILVLGAPEFFLAGFSSYLGKDVVPFLPSQQIFFIPQGIAMCFYGIAGLFIGSYLFCTIVWDVGGGYNRFDKREKKIYLFRWGFPGENRRICLQFPVKDIQAIRLEIRQNISIFPRSVLRIKIRGYQDITLAHTVEDLVFSETEEKAAELARFLGVSIEGL